MNIGRLRQYALFGVEYRYRAEIRIDEGGWGDTKHGGYESGFTHGVRNVIAQDEESAKYACQRAIHTYKDAEVLGIVLPRQPSSDPRDGDLGKGHGLPIDGALWNEIG